MIQWYKFIVYKARRLLGQGSLRGSQLSQRTGSHSAWAEELSIKKGKLPVPSKHRFWRFRLIKYAQQGKDSVPSIGKSDRIAEICIGSDLQWARPSKSRTKQTNKIESTCSGVAWNVFFKQLQLWFDKVWTSNHFEVWSHYGSQLIFVLEQTWKSFLWRNKVLFWVQWLWAWEARIIQDNNDSDFMSKARVYLAWQWKKIHNLGS